MTYRHTDEVNVKRHSVLRMVNSWRFWVTMLVLAVGGITLWGINLTQRVIREQAAREARIQADYRACVQSIPSLKSISLHVQGVNDMARILVNNSRKLLKTPPLAIRRQNLRDLRRAEKKIAAVKSFPVPTMRSCERRRQQLGG